MTCEEFSTAALDLGLATGDSDLQRAAREHLRECPHCAALHENWLALHEDLRMLAAETAGAEASPRVKMRLLQEFRTKHGTVKRRRTALILGWSLAAAAVVVLAVAWASWYSHRAPNMAGIRPNPLQAPISKSNGNSPSQGSGSVQPDSNDLVIASNGYGDFTMLPDSIPPVPEDATVVRVEMQRAALGTLGLTVNEEHASDLIQVDLLVGDDGVPQAIRLPQTSAASGN